MTEHYETAQGFRHPPGATPQTNGVNFAVFSRDATAVQLWLFDAVDSPEPFQVIQLDPKVNHTFYIWHIEVIGLPFGTWYAWRMDGTNDTGVSGRRFDYDKCLLDPWSRAVSQKLWDRGAACVPGDNTARSLRSMVVDPDYDWEDDRPLDIPNENTIIYELHIGGFTRHESSQVEHRGTFAGLTEKIPYLQALGITHVELLPIMAFDEQDVPSATAERGLSNYWGYSTHSFFCPHPSYCVTPEQGTHVNEFRDMVKALHKAGIGVILDVVYNHTAEGGRDGPVISFKGMANDIFYHLEAEDRSQFRDYTGCGNTFNCNHPFVTQFILSSLEFWVRLMHVDGFRFDLASALSRGEDGSPMHDAPVLWSIELSNRLARSRVIAEAWDAVGLYQVGAFPGYRWSEWNGKYRDDMRRFLRGDGGMISDIATRLGGSSDLYLHQGRLPFNSINFITCHDGFTLNDLFSYEQKHNEANGEQNRDGHNDNLSLNFGIEGDTDDAGILELRKRQAKNAMTLLLLSQGIPMLLAGDEVLRTQRGNNNGYCQDNEVSWFDWTLVDRNADMLRFVQQMVALRRRHPSLMRRRFLTGEPDGGRGLPDIIWHGETLGAPAWDDPEARSLAFTLTAVCEDEPDLHVMFNQSDHDIDMPIPPHTDHRWQRAVDTSLVSPDDIATPACQVGMEGDAYLVRARSAVVLEGFAMRSATN